MSALLLSASAQATRTAPDGSAETVSRCPQVSAGVVELHP